MLEPSYFAREPNVNNKKGLNPPRRIQPFSKESAYGATLKPAFNVATKVAFATK